jgi:hypothetical protein
MVLPQPAIDRVVLAAVLPAVLIAGCASRAGTPVERAPTRDARLMHSAETAQREGRRPEALALYENVTATSGAPEVARQAWLAIGLLHLGDATNADMSKAEAALRAARSLYEAREEPPVLTALLAMLDTLRDVRGAAATARLLHERDLAARDEDLRVVRRSIAQLRHEIEKRDAALKKAAEAAIGRGAADR